MSLFKPSTETGKSVHDKILIYGPTHTSKTHAALGWPDPALVDVENRGAHFADRFTFFHARPRTQEEVVAVLDELKTGAIGCASIIFDSYSADYEKLIVSHTSTFVSEGKTIATTDYATVNRRIAPVREFLFATFERDLIVIAHQQQKYDRNGKQFTARREPEFFGDAKFRYAFDFIFRTEPTGNDPRVHAVKFVVEKSASPRLKIGDFLLVRPNESLYKVFRARISPVAGVEKPAARDVSPTSPPSTSHSNGNGKQSQLQKKISRVAVLRDQLGLNELEIGTFVRGCCNHRTAAYAELEESELDRLIVVLEKRRPAVKA